MDALKKKKKSHRKVWDEIKQTLDMRFKPNV